MWTDESWDRPDSKCHELRRLFPAWPAAGSQFGPGSTPSGWPYRQTPGMAEEGYHLVTTPVLSLTFWSHAGHLLLIAAPSWLHLQGCVFMAATFPCLVTAGSQS